MENNKRKNIYIVIFVITTIMAACVAVYFGIMKKTGDKKIDELTASLQNNTSDNATENNCDDNVKVIEKEKVVYQYTMPTFDATKCINADSKLEYHMYTETSFNGVTCKINYDKKSATLTINWDIVKNYYGIGISNGDVQSIQTVEINNFNQEILDMDIYCFGHTWQGETISFLMEDGTIEYIPLYKALKNNDYRSYGKLSNLRDIVQISEGSCGNKEGGGYASIFAIKQDGSFYNLQPILMDTGNFYFD